MNAKALGAATAALLLSACAHAYPDLAKFEDLKPIPKDSSDELGVILQEAATLQASYAKGYKTTAKRQDISQLPIIGLAAAAAWVLLNDKEKAAKKAGKIGIVGLSYSSARDQLIAKGLPEAYIKGHGALTCVLAEGSMFHGTKADERHAAFENQRDQVETALTALSTLRYEAPTDSKNQEMLKAARAVADQAIAAARTADTNSLNQAGVYDNAAPAFRKAVSSVSVSVASKGRERVDVDFDSIRDSMAAPKDGQSRGVVRAGRSSAKLIEDLARYSSELMTESARLSAVTPDYAQSIENLEDCVEQAE